MQIGEDELEFLLGKSSDNLLPELCNKQVISSASKTCASGNNQGLPEKLARLRLSRRSVRLKTFESHDKKLKIWRSRSTYDNGISMQGSIPPLCNAVGIALHCKACNNNAHRGKVPSAKICGPAQAFRFEEFNPSARQLWWMQHDAVRRELFSSYFKFFKICLGFLNEF